MHSATHRDDVTHHHRLDAARAPCMQTLTMQSATRRDDVTHHHRLDAALAYNDAYVVCGSENGDLCYWDLVEGKLLHQFKAHDGVVYGGRFRTELCTRGVPLSFTPLLRLKRASV
jgi:hypothetical protein